VRWAAAEGVLARGKLAEAVHGTFRPKFLQSCLEGLACQMSVPFSLHWTIVHLQQPGQLTMKTILVPTQNISSMKSTLETALLLAQRTAAYIEGVPLWFGAPEFVVAELASSFSIEIYRARRKEETAEARKLFETFMQEHGVAAARTTADRSWCGWFAEVPPGEGLVGSHGRAFDVIVMSRPDADTVAPYVRAIESGLFESGRPVLLSPPTAPKQIATNIMIHWNGSTEQARANALAMPLLRLAGRVTVLTVVGGQGVPGPSADQVRKQLRYNDIAAEPLSIELEGRSTGEAVLAAAMAEGCDLLVKGAFTTGRLRQTIFGGTTSHIMAHADLPVLMAH
jgi:nucleotide-binding universal stress UspA family protein